MFPKYVHIRSIKGVYYSTTKSRADHFVSTRLSICSRRAYKRTTCEPATDHLCRRRSVTYVVPTLLVIGTCARVWCIITINTNKTKKLIRFHFAIYLLCGADIFCQYSLGSFLSESVYSIIPQVWK